MDVILSSASVSFVLPAEAAMWLTIAGIVIAIVIYSLERVPLEVTSAGVIVAFTVFFTIFPVPDPAGRNLLDAEALLSGFANPALISILAFLIIGQGLFQAGALEGPTRLMMRVGRERPQATLIGVLIMAGAVSAFMNNTPVVVMFIPIISVLAARSGQVPSRVMMPLTFMCVLGGTTTLIGSSTNLLVAQSARNAGLANIGFFDITPMGLILAGVGAVYVLAVLPRWLPSRGSMADALVGDRKQFIAEIVLVKDHPLIGAKAVDGAFKQLPDIKVHLIQRGEQPIPKPFEGCELQENDMLVVSATRKALTDLLASKPDYLKGMIARHGGDKELEAGDAHGGVQIANDLVVTEAVVAPGSRLVGYSIDYIGFRLLTDCIVLGIQRRSRMVRQNLQNVRLEAGDVLLLMGRLPHIRKLRTNRDLLLLEWAMTDMPNVEKAMSARLIFAGVVLSSAFNLVPIVIAALAGALAMVVAGCINVRQAARAVDRRIFLLIGAAIAMGTALEATGGARYFAQVMVNAVDGAGPTVVLSAFFLLVALMTNILSNNATAVLFAPIAIQISAQLGVDPRVFLFATIFAANTSFATPVGYQTNLLVMGPGQYSFRDFVTAGIPLVLLIWIAFSLVAPWYFGLA